MKREDITLPSAAPGRRLHTVIRSPDEEPRAVLQISHGMMEHIGRYEAFAEALAGRGIAVVGHDHLGHGTSVTDERDRGFFAEGDASEALIRDLRSVTLEAKRRFPGRPVFLVGHSMGSFFARRYLPLFGGEIAGAVFMGTGWFPNPAAGFGKHLSRAICRIRGERAASPLLDEIIVGRNVKAFPEDGRLGWLSKRRQNIADYEADPLCGFRFTAGAYRDFLTILSAVADEDGYDGIRRTLPILVISGELDPVGGKTAVRKVAAEYRRLGFTDVTEKIVPDDRHEILNEDDREEVCAYLAAWILERVR
ncbi:MAG: alpha/beta hydrolase [Clostridia bacterium]|nr:alpha/beta hydrolase [Clostridia bacterium]